MRILLLILLVVYCPLSLSFDTLDESEMADVSAQYVGGTPTEIDANFHQTSKTSNSNESQVIISAPMPSVQLLTPVQMNVNEIAPLLDGTIEHNQNPFSVYSPWVMPN